MFIVNTRVEQTEEIQKGVFLLKVHSPEIASAASPGQFCNIKVSDSNYPLLRRPFSICDVKNDSVYFMFTIVGEGTQTLSEKKVGDTLEILGPLGNGFNYSGDYEIAVIVVGGIGAAPFPFLINKLNNECNKICFSGGRTKDDIIQYGMVNNFISTDDGSEGFKGTVIDLLKSKEEIFKEGTTKIFGCGPTPMLKALSEFSIKNNLNCEISTESAMACGFGICQGCPIEEKDKDKYLLVCKDGPVFNVKDVIL